MEKKTIRRLTAGPLFAVAALCAPALLAGGCVDDLQDIADGATCKADIVASVDAFQGAVDALMTVSGKMKGSVALACANIASDLGASDVPDVGADGSKASDDDVEKACKLAAGAIDAEVKAGATIGIAVQGGGCSVNASLQASCEASCSVDGSCDPGGVEARCDPGELSGECSGECKGSCTVETGSVACEGSCSGTCKGKCEGKCVGDESGGECEGKCEGTCEGECSGTCDVVPPSATCEGSCKGGCSVEYKAPKCEAELTPPSCDIDADCQAGCDAQGKLEAECSAPKVVVTIEGSANANLQTTLEANLPSLLLVIEQGELFVEAAGTVATTGVDVVEAAIGVPACAAKFAGSILGEFQAAVSASVSVSVSVEASASVSGSAGG